jgi:hypothetical protein
MKAIKSITILTLVTGLLLAVSSCSHQTCPTYSKADSNTTEVKA